MVIFRWSHALETGIPMIDQQHKQVVEVCNQFFIRRKCGGNKQAVAECMSFLLQYIQYHFQAEEAFQIMCGYPNYQNHCALHKATSTQIKFFSVKIEQSNYAEKIIEDFYQFLIDWVQKHIYEEDMDFAQYYIQATREKQDAITSQV